MHFSVVLQLQSDVKETHSGNRVMDSALACCTGGPGLIPLVGKSKAQYSAVFLPLGIGWFVTEMEPVKIVHDLASFCCL